MLSEQVYVEEEQDYEPEYGTITMVDITNENRSVVTLAKYNPQLHHRVVHPGLNFQGTCMNQTCKVFSKEVWIRKGFGLFYIHKAVTESNCPICNKQVPFKTIVNFGYRNCKIKIEGMRSKDNTKLNYEEQQTQGKLIKFKNFQGQTVQWQYLLMQVVQK